MGISANQHMHIRTPGKVDAGILSLTPAAVSGLWSWWAADLETGYNDGDAIGTFLDQSGNGRSPTSAGAVRPTYKTNIINGLPALLYSGAQGHSLASEARLATATYFVVWQRSNAGNNDVILLSSGAEYAYLQYGGTWYSAGGVSASVAMAAGSFKLKCARYDGVNITMLTNGSQDANPANNSNCVFKNVGGVGFSLAGYIAEILVYNAALTVADRQFVELYLNNKYALW